MSQTKGGQTINLTTARYSRSERYVVSWRLMKRITLALILGLSATIARGDEYAIIDDIFRSVRLIHWLNEMNGLCSTKGRV